MRYIQNLPLVILLIIVGAIQASAQSTTIPAKLPFTIDRSKPFDPEKFIGPGWSIIEEDQRSLSLSEIDLAKVRFESGLNDGESIVSGEEKLKRLTAVPEIRLDAKLGQAWYEEEGQVTLRWLHDTYGIKWIELAGTVLRDPDGTRYFLVLRRYVDGSWGWDDDWLDDGRDRGSVSPLLTNLHSFGDWELSSDVRAFCSLHSSPRRTFSRRGLLRFDTSSLWCLIEKTRTRSV